MSRPLKQVWNPNAARGKGVERLYTYIGGGGSLGRHSAPHVLVDQSPNRGPEVDWPRVVQGGVKMGWKWLMRGEYGRKTG